VRKTGRMSRANAQHRVLVWAAGLAAAASCWLILHFFFDFGFFFAEEQRAPGGASSKLALLTAVIPLGLAYLVLRKRGSFESAFVPVLWGAAAGSAVAVLTSVPDRRIMAAVIALIVVVIAGFISAGVRMEQADAERNRRHITRVQGAGTKAVAQIVDVEFMRSWHHGCPRFTVTAQLPTPSGVRSVTALLHTEPAAAPIVGGTVIVWYIGDGDPQDDVHLEPDPHSDREPGASERYARPGN